MKRCKLRTIGTDNSIMVDVPWFTRTVGLYIELHVIIRSRYCLLIILSNEMVAVKPFLTKNLYYLFVQ